MRKDKQLSIGYIEDAYETDLKDSILLVIMGVPFGKPNAGTAIREHP